jgi:hypothetical protein
MKVVAPASHRSRAWRIPTAVAAFARAQVALLVAEWNVRRREVGELIAQVNASGESGELIAQVNASGKAEDADQVARSLLADRGVQHGPLPHVNPEGGATAASGTAPQYSYGAARRDVVAIHRAARHGLFRPRCLTRSIALQRMLARRGLPARVCIGVRREASSLEAHAWVELHGRIMGDDPSHVARFAPLAAFVSR